ncbi:sirohydrochlorin cobaltochelatase [Ferrimonas lipolytica]|uniref:Cobalamin biosynthesis protein CbiK n=1 Tax=Ferrimonas lipolytica TaxID=2724191 RepID=A0A6H1UD83_9GAMM|nr:sirohydrochlorin cobaltochelatase [Ferrimonas lipolytica]QIZ76313.1 cobalamin biosynthesis protein CbiK [Ferrimonas lipolytica]
MKRQRHYQQGRALVICCFGSVVDQARFDALLEQAHKRYPDCEVRLAVSSRMVLNRLSDRELYTLPEQLAQLDRGGYRQILVASCYLYPTEEHQQLKQVVEGFKQFSLSRLAYTPALLQTVNGANSILAALAARFPMEEGVHNLFIHHGAPQLDNAGYNAIWYSQQLLEQLGERNHCCSLEGANPYPLVAAKLKQQLAAAKRVRLIPLLLVSGNHAVNDVVSIQADLQQLTEVEIAAPITSERFCLLDLTAVTETLWKQIDTEFNKLGELA